MGGSYNPIHIGHLMLADAVALRYGYDTVAFVPAFLSPFKDGHSGCTADDRLAMVKLAIADNPAFYCEPCEIQRQGVSYTIDTLKFLNDLLEGFAGWREAECIPDYADIIVGNRIIDRYSMARAASAGKVPHLRVDNALLPVSSSGIRAAIQEKKSWRYLVPSAVYSYIKEHKLYE